MDLVMKKGLSFNEYGQLPHSCSLSKNHNRRYKFDIVPKAGV